MPTISRKISSKEAEGKESKKFIAKEKNMWKDTQANSERETHLWEV